MTAAEAYLVEFNDCIYVPMFTKPVKFRRLLLVIYGFSERTLWLWRKYCFNMFRTEVKMKTYAWIQENIYFTKDIFQLENPNYNKEHDWASVESWRSGWQVSVVVFLHTFYSYFICSKPCWLSIPEVFVASSNFRIQKVHLKIV